MSDIRRVIVSGRVGQDAEVRQVGDTDLGTFSLAVNQYRGRDRDEETAWWRVQVWGGRSKVCDYIRKGMKLTVEGELDKSTKEVDGEERTYININATNIVLPDQNGGTSGSKTSRKARNDDLPF